jgi:hypothetical protein
MAIVVSHAADGASVPQHTHAFRGILRSAHAALGARDGWFAAWWWSAHTALDSASTRCDETTIEIRRRGRAAPKPAHIALKRLISEDRRPRVILWRE